jgi:Mrp family chromosome partitioning ATPase
MLNNTWRRTSLFFTSAGAHEGATETAVNLATIMSRRTESALLVELQLTDPGLWQLLGQPPVKSGFEQALRGKATFEECLQHISGEKIDVLLLREPMSVLEAEHLSGALNDFLEWAEERFAWMIVDCPPVLGPAWTRWFDLNADPVVLVARREKTIKHQLRKAAKHLGDRLAGTVLSSAENGSSMPRVRPSKNGTVASNGRPGAPLPPPS